jgi:hypothetical protein
MVDYRLGIGLVGEILVRRYNFSRYEFRKPVEVETKRQGLDPSKRIDLQSVGNKMVHLNPRYWGDLIKESILQDSSKVPYVVEGIRNLGDIEALRELQGFFLIGVRAPFEIRCTRDYLIECRRTPGLDEYEHRRSFTEQDDRDNGRIAGGQQTLACIRYAQHIINNSIDSRPLLEQSVEALVSKLLPARKS